MKDQMTTAMHVEHVEVGALRPYARNARTHSKKQLKIAPRTETPLL
jgi:hypothetical protein